MKEGDSYEGRESNEGWRIVWRRENHMKGENPMKEGESYESYEEGRIIWRRGNPMKEGESYEGGGILWREIIQWRMLYCNYCSEESKEVLKQTFNIYY